MSSRGYPSSPMRLPDNPTGSFPLGPRHHSPVAYKPGWLRKAMISFIRLSILSRFASASRSCSFCIPEMSTIPSREIPQNPRI